MTLQQLLDEWNGKKLDFDGAYGPQCVDIIKQYCQDVLNVPVWTGEPKNYGQIADPRFFAYNKNTPFYIPPEGAIAIWNGNEGEGHGHVAIVTHAKLLKFVSFDQNWPKGSPCMLVNHNYKNVTGFLVPRGKDVLSQYNALVDEIRKLLDRFPTLTA